MDQLVANKTRRVLDAQVVATATPTAYPTFPTGPTAGVVQFKGDMLGARIAGFTWNMTVLTTFTAADATVQTSDDGETWTTLKAFAQKTGTGSAKIDLLDTDPKPLRFVRLLVTMTGTPGTSTHTFDVHYNQVGPRGGLADGIPDRN